MRDVVDGWYNVQWIMYYLYLTISHIEFYFVLKKSRALNLVVHIFFFAVEWGIVYSGETKVYGWCMTEVFLWRHSFSPWISDASSVVDVFCLPRTSFQKLFFIGFNGREIFFWAENCRGGPDSKIYLLKKKYMYKIEVNFLLSNIWWFS